MSDADRTYTVEQAAAELGVSAQEVRATAAHYEFGLDRRRPEWIGPEELETLRTYFQARTSTRS